jgi:TetR/AcrR family transcriptional regulator, transcriptional repressor for nem operon
VPQRNLKEQLIDGGARVLFEKGFHAASVNDIVAAADVPKGSFYNHFESKEALALEVTRRYAASYELDQLQAPGEQPLQRLREHFEATTEGTVARGVELGCLLGNFSTELAAHSPAIREQVAASFAAWSGAVAAALEEAQAAGQLDPALDATALGAYLVDAYEGAVARAKVTGGREPLDAFVRTTFDVLLPG